MVITERMGCSLINNNDTRFPLQIYQEEDFDTWLKQFGDLIKD